MIALLLCCLTAFASVSPSRVVPVVKVRAEVSADLRTISGTFEASEMDGLNWVDLLSKLPNPTSDRIQHRTFPGPKESGKVWMEPPPASGRSRSFNAVLPRRFGASGFVPGRGLFSNGLWHPHALINGRLAQVQWDVVLALPKGATGVLNGTVGQHTVRYQGTAERLSLSVLYGARVQTFDLTDSATITLVDGGPERRHRDMRTIAVAMTGIDLEHANSFVVIETPMRRRLLRGGPRTLFMSDRALRVTPPDWAMHIPSLQQGLQRASLDITDPWLRDLAGSILRVGEYEKRSAKKLAKWRAWMPRVDSFLYDGRLPFATETLEEGWSHERIEDDPLELTEATAPAATAAWKMQALHGPEVMRTWATAMASGASFDQANDLAGLSESDFADWRTWPPVTDVSVDVERDGSTWRITLKRDAPNDAPAEPIAFQIGTETQQWTTGVGPDTLTIPVTQRPERVRIDPSALVLQNDRQNDGWPRPWSVTLTGSLSEINVSRRRPTASGYIVARNQRSSHWMHALIANTNPIEMASAYYSLGYEFGRKLDRRNRIWRVWAGPSAAFLDPAFRETAAGHTAIDMRAGIRVDTRNNWPFSRRGIRLATGVSNGFVPNEGTRWQSVSSQAVGLVDLPGPFVWANQFKAGSTTSEVNHRQFSIGGSNGIQGLPIDAQFGKTRLYGTSEIRFTPVRGASIPMWLWWVTTVQLSGSVEAAKIDDTTAAGWTAGLGVVSDIWGQTPYFTGIWVAKSLDYGDFSGLDPTQVYLRLGQNF